MGISTTHMSHIETANTKLSLPVFVALAQVLEVETDALLYDAPPLSVSRTEREIAALIDGCTAQQAKVILEVVRSTSQALAAYL